MEESEQDRTAENRRILAKRLEAVGWGLFFMWLGVAFLADVGWGAGLLGVGVITLGIQAARKHFALSVDRFWLVVGIVFALWGVLELLRIEINRVSFAGNLLPILSIGIGIAIVLSALPRKSHH